MIYMGNINEDLNRVLAEWNPIGVDPAMADEEYKSYIPLILEYIENKQQLENCLEDILINKLEVGYDPTIKEHLDDLHRVCDSLIQVYQSKKIS